ncbi:MAG: hypothetical protein ABSC37_06940 [Xanthobacteraceae bacterium]|jgi:hypothetical protein
MLSLTPIYLVLFLLLFGYFSRKQLRQWWIRRKLKSAGVPGGTVEPPALTTRGEFDLLQAGGR